MGNRLTILGAVADVAPLPGARAPGGAELSAGGNHDSVLLSRHRRLVSEPLMWGDGFNEGRIGP